MKIIFPTYPFRIRKSSNGNDIFDIIRKKFVALTPEEWVRQHWIHYLVKEMNYPRSLIAIEMELKVNRMKRRCDIVLHDQSGVAVMIVECKAPEVRITQKVFEQIAGYNLELRVKYLVVSNGETTYACQMDYEKNQWHLLRQLPSSASFKQANK